MLIPELLLNTLDDLSGEDFGRFKWHLKLEVVENCVPMTVASMEGAKRQDIVDKMIQSYGEASAVALTAKVLQRMCMMGTAQKLTSAYAAGTPSASSSSSSSSSATAPPAVPASVTAQDGSVVVAPNIIGSTAGSLNITINRT